MSKKSAIFVSTKGNNMKTIIGRIGMWYKNRKNGVKILSEKEWNRIVKPNRIVIVL